MFALNGGNIASQNDHVIAGHRSNGLNGDHNSDLITCAQWAVINKTLVTVDNPRPIQAQSWIVNYGVCSLKGDDGGKSRWRNDIGITQGSGRFNISVCGTVIASGISKLSDFRARHYIGLRSGINATNEPGI
jgi:hypothetical protein